MRVDQRCFSKFCSYGMASVSFATSFYFAVMTIGLVGANFCTQKNLGNSDESSVVIFQCNSNQLQAMNVYIYGVFTLISITFSACLAGRLGSGEREPA